MYSARRFARFTCFLALLVSIFGALQGVSQTSPGQKPDVVLQGNVTYENRQTYLELPFDVPADATRVSVELAYTEHDKHTNIDLGVFDTQRFRGWSGGNKSFFTISENDATPSYLPGVLPAGKWTLILGVPNIEKGITSHYVAKIMFDRDGRSFASSTFSRAPLKSGPAWYRGDLHMHDAHSDGSCKSQSGQKVPCPLYKTVEAAAARKLDFIAITDHNTTSQYDDMRELQPYFDQILLMPGREITTFYGHGNVFGTTSFIDFRLSSKHVPTINQLLREVQQHHGFFSINHPGSPTGAMCMGCGWTAPDTDYHLAGAIEAVNGGSMDGPQSGLPFWQARLNEGFRLTGIGDSDNHNATTPPMENSAIGLPTTVVYAENLSEKAILDGIRAGHVFIDMEGTYDRGMEFSVEAGGKEHAMGDALASPNGQKLHFKIKLIALEGAHAEVLLDGKPFEQVAQTGLVPAKAASDERSFDYQSDGKRHWVRANVRSAEGKLLLVGNPIYLNF